jgi:hypothetical protein
LIGGACEIIRQAGDYCVVKKDDTVCISASVSSL